MISQMSFCAYPEKPGQVLRGQREQNNPRPV